MIRYELYDAYGKKVHEHISDATNFATVIIEHNGKFYRPIAHDLSSEVNSAKCVPVDVLRCAGVQNETVSK